MIKPEQLEYITARLNKNENAERLKKAKQERKLGIWWHYNRAKNMLNTLETSPHFLKAFYENCYTQSIRKIDWIMQKENWQ